MIAPARTVAFHALQAVGSGRVDLGETLARGRARLEDSRDRALLAQIVTGTLRWRGALDYQIERAAGRPLTKLDDEVVTVLRLGLYQILHLERVPVSAVVNDAVALVRKAGKSSAAGFVNGILRRLARERATLRWPPRPVSTAGPEARADTLQYLAHTCSHPTWLVERWLDRHGFDAAEAWVRFNNTPAPLCLRANLQKTTRATLATELAERGVRTRPTLYAPHGLIVDDGQPLGTPLADTGTFFVQDEASQVIPELLQVGPAARVLDACAAPGGKTVAVANALGPAGLVVASDVRRRRARLAAETLARAGVTPRVVHMADEGPWPFRPLFTHVLVDAPCSGLGTLRRDPDIRWRRVPEDLPRFAAAQDRLLARAATVLRPGGRLVYSTCSSEPDENDAVVARFLEAHPAFRLRRLQELPGLAAEIAGLADGSGCLRTDPARHGLEAFFAAVLER